MFPTSLQHPYAPRGRRRGRNDPNSRDYICPCGKSYLSYPALFTHIKIKHNGRAPGQIIKPKSQNPSKRGRPRQVFYIQFQQKQVFDSDSDTNDIAANCIDRLCDFVTDFQKLQQSLCSKLKDMYMKDAFYRVYVDYNPQQQQPRYNERQDLYQQYTDNVFCQLIAQVNKRLNEPFHIDSVMVLLMLLGHFVNQGQVVGENVVERRRMQEEEQEEEYDEGYEEGEDVGEYEDMVENNELIAQEQQYHSSSEQQQQNINNHINTNNNHQNNMQQQKAQQQQKHQQHINNHQIQQLQLQQPQQQQQQQYEQHIQQQNIKQNQQKIPLKSQQQQKQQQQQQQYEEQQQFLEQPNNQDTLMKLKHQPIRNIVNYVNDFIINYENKYYHTHHLQQYPLFQQKNVKIFLELFFSWLSMKKYVGYKLRVNHHYQ